MYIVKYSPAKSGWKGPAPSKAEHERDNLYKQLGTGGVDFAGFIAALRSHGYDGWVSLDFDPVRPGDRTIPENMAFRRNYVIEKLRASLRPAKGGNS
jgi:sugar phosphate isomerase/epimerase